MFQRQFTDFEKSIIDIIITYKSGEAISIVKLLESAFFIKDTGRSLIIQLKEQYAMFFLPLMIFHDKEKQHKEINRFVELFSLIDYLNKQGYITIFREGHLQKEEICYVGNEFDNPRAENGKLILNSKGIYSVKPEEIKNEQGDVIYKGIEFKENELILKNATGKIVISDKILTIKNSPVKEKEKSNKGELFFKGLTFLLLQAVLIFVFFVKKDIEELYTKDRYSINEKIERVSKKIDLNRYKDSVDHKRSLAKKTIKQVIRSKKYGIDISRWNGDLLNEKLPDSISFVICKATEGITWVDPNFTKNWAKSKELKLVKGAYHFYLVNDDPIIQAEHFWKQIKDIESNDITPIIDVERGSLNDEKDIDPITFQAGILIFLNHLERLSSRVPMVYVDLYFADKYLTHNKFSNYPLWIADYDSKDRPEIPEVWKDVGYTIWQKSSEYKIDSKATDLDVFK